MPVPKFLRAKIANAISKLLAATGKVAVVKNDDARTTRNSQRRNVISKVSGQPVQPVSSHYTEAVALKSSIFKEAGASFWDRPLIPRAIPVGVVPIVPLILSKQQNSSAHNSKHQGNTSHSVLQSGNPTGGLCDLCAATSNF